jgi:predicted nucleic acid-binding Zn ribbon protein
MPLREYKCTCGNSQDELFSADYPSTMICAKCGGRAKYSFGGATFRVDFRDGYDVGAGEYFNSNRARNNFIAENGLRRKR